MQYIYIIYMQSSLGLAAQKTSTNSFSVLISIILLASSHNFHCPAFSKHPKRDEDVWVMLIKNARRSDTDLYVCEVNSEPAIKTFHTLTGKLVATNSQMEATGKLSNEKQTIQNETHGMAPSLRQMPGLVLITYNIHYNVFYMISYDNCVLALLRFHSLIPRFVGRKNECYI